MMKTKRTHRLSEISLILVLVLAVIFAMQEPAFAKSTALKAPGSVKAVSKSSSSAEVSWKKSQNAKKYQVYRYYSKTGKWKLATTTTSTKVTYKGLAANTTYKFKVRSLSGSKKSAFSKVVSAKTAKKPQTSKPESPSVSNYEERYNEEMLRLVNEFRKSSGRQPLTYNHDIQAAADLRAKEAIKSPDLGHNRYDKNGKLNNCFSVFSDLNLNIRYTSAGENLAWRGYQSNPETAAKSLFEQWKNSPGHRDNMLSSSFTSMATAIAYDKNGSAGYRYSAAAVQLFLRQ